MNYTPGPWKYVTNVGPTKALITEDDGSTIVELRLNVRDSRLEANARLIAAAPELLEVCKDALESLRRLPYDWQPGRPVAYRVTIMQELEKAIAKAQGE